MHIHITVHTSPEVHRIQSQNPHLVAVGGPDTQAEAPVGSLSRSLPPRPSRRISSNFLGFP